MLYFVPELEDTVLVCTVCLTEYYREPADGYCDVEIECAVSDGSSLQTVH